MGSLSPKNDSLIITQLSIAGFDPKTTASSLASSLERILNCVIWRCRLKLSSPPPDSYPNFILDLNHQLSPRSSSRPPSAVVPHAFLHFATPAGAQRALDLSSRCELLLDGKPLTVLSSPQSSTCVSRRQSTPPFSFPDAILSIGSLTGKSLFFSAARVAPVLFLLDPFDSSCKFFISRDLGFSVRGSKEVEIIKCDLKLEFLIRDVMEVKTYNESDCLVLMLQLTLNSAPLIYYRTADDDIHDTSAGSFLLDDEDPWIRTTDCTPNGAIGRCTCFKVSMKPRFGGKLKKALDYMRERRIEAAMPEMPIAVQEEPGFEWTDSDHFFCFHFKEGVSFANMFMVNALVHKGIFNHHKLTDEFFELLRGQNEALNDAALRHIYGYKKPVFDACRRLKMVQDWHLRFPNLVKTPKACDDNMEVRRLLITPTKFFCLPPDVELANRVLREYRHISDRFLRVTFMDEGMQKLNSNVLNFYVAPIVKEITKHSFKQMTTMYQRVRSITKEGFYLCGRKYSFLAFSSNQLRDCSAWFFAEDGKTSVLDITSWMGKFQNKNVAKYAARMGQCFSSTYATVEVPRKEFIEISDIERNNYCFSDGIGKITPDLAMEVAEKLQLTENPPSAYQIRYAGYKGVIAVWPGNGDRIRLVLRPSMNKFISKHATLEIVSWTRFQPCFLNRQIVTLLSALGVPDDVFSRMQDDMVHKLDQILVDPDIAFEVLTTSCSEQGNIAAMMLSAGFQPRTEPHLRAMLSCIRLSQLKDLSFKARIFVPKGRWLMGCFDELGVLEDGQCFIQASTPSLENCFLKHGSRFSGVVKKRQIVVGMVALAKNPCLHPGDVRILEAVDVPGLHHLVDCLVFPQKGERPHSHEASGSDLDGDLYFVTWDENLIPPAKKSWMPMAYTPAETKLEPRQIIHQDIIDFFVKNLSNENLGVICNAHVVHADQSDYGAMDEKCLKLAELAATAVDFPKTGKVVSMPASLKPKLYPDFMEKDKSLTYKSEKILGRLYRKIKDASDEDNSSELIAAYQDLPYDTNLEIPEASQYLTDAWDTKCSYDRQLNALLGQFQIDKEGEVVTGHVCSLSKVNGRKQGEIKERLKNAYYALNKKYRRAFDEIGPNYAQLTDDERNYIYESKASAWYQVTYHPKWVEKSIQIREAAGELVPPRLSFAWIPADYLVQIKVRSQKGKVGAGAPINSLASYLSERM